MKRKTKKILLFPKKKKGLTLINFSLRNLFMKGIANYYPNRNGEYF